MSNNVGTETYWVIMIENGFDSAYPEIVFGSKKEASDYKIEKDTNKESSRHYPMRYLVETPFKPREIW
ncbi:hypothetical protein CHOTACABRAS_186 [Bacillus phage Chotacabras]|nr:hypothetical protein CHOTACABRAS_186 [Bacillus phage Chotacabras]